MAEKDDKITGGDPFHSGHTRVLGEEDGLAPTPAAPSGGKSQHFNQDADWGTKTKAMPLEAFDGLDRLPSQPGAPGMHSSGQTMALIPDGHVPPAPKPSPLPEAPKPSLPQPPPLAGYGDKTAAMPGLEPDPSTSGGYGSGGSGGSGWSGKSGFGAFGTASGASGAGSGTSADGAGGGGAGGIPYLETQAIDVGSASQMQPPSYSPPPGPSHQQDEPEKTVLLDSAAMMESLKSGAPAPPAPGPPPYRPPPPQHAPPPPRPAPPAPHQFDDDGLAIGGEKTVILQDVQAMLPPELKQMHAAAPAAPKKATKGSFVIFVPETEPILFELMPGITTVGRGMENHLVLGDPYASRKHLVITCRDGQYHMEDTGSDNGTLVNGQVSTSKVLQTGDLVEIGSVMMRFVAGDVGPEHQGRPAPAGAPATMAQVAAAGPPPPVPAARPVARRRVSKGQLVLLLSLVFATLALIAVMVVIFLQRQ